MSLILENEKLKRIVESQQLKILKLESLLEKIKNEYFYVPPYSEAKKKNIRTMPVKDTSQMCKQNRLKKAA